MACPGSNKIAWKAQRELAKEVGDERVVPIDVLDDGIVNMLDKMVLESQAAIEEKMKRERKATLVRMQSSLSNSEDIELDLSCPICLEFMSTSDNIPMVLSPCGHSICGACYQSLKKYSSSSCPICRRPIKEGIPSHVMKHVVSAIQNKKEESSPSSHCVAHDFQHAPAREQLSPEAVVERRLQILEEEIEKHQLILDTYSDVEEGYYRAIDAIDEKMKRLERARAAVEREFADTKAKRDAARDKVDVLRSVVRKLRTEARKRQYVGDQDQR